MPNGLRRSTLTRSVHQPSTILEQDRPSTAESSSISSDPSSSYHDEFLVERKPEQFETTTQPFKISSSSSSVASSEASQRTYSTKVNENNESLLNSSLRIHSSSSTDSSKKEEPVEMLVQRSSSMNKNVIKSPSIGEPNPTIEKHDEELPPKVSI